MVDDLIKKRNQFRQAGRFAEADKIRKEIEDRGYQVIDRPNGSSLVSKSKTTDSATPEKSYLTLFGSGEISTVGRSIHDYILTGINKKPVKIVIISTPAGFQPNVKVVHEEIAEFFQKSLVNFHPQVQIIYANNREEANNPDILFPLKSADYIFIGPGSPTYAVKNLKDTLLYQEVISCVNRGASLSLSSAAVIAFSNHCLPVYEIYKVGLPLYWETGLNFYEKFFQKLTIIPHFNNQEGGEKLDTSRCFMGQGRYIKLHKLLPKNEIVWGIDELTATVIDLKSKEIKVMGKGKLHRLDSRVIY